MEHDPAEHEYRQFQEYMDSYLEGKEEGAPEEQEEKLLSLANDIYDRNVTDLHMQQRHDEMVSIMRSMMAANGVDTYDPAVINVIESSWNVLQAFNIMALPMSASLNAVLAHVQLVNDLLLLMVKALRDSSGQSLPNFDA